MKTITVVAVSGWRVEQHALALRLTLRNLPKPANGLLISPYRPDNWHGKWIDSGPLGFYDANQFVVQQLWKHIETDYALIVQWDGFAINREAWTDGFLEYDYIGAPWPWWLSLLPWCCPSLKHRVGNGGFSLRSKKWLEACAAIPFNGSEAEDVFYCKRHVKELLDQGLKVAPQTVARAFSWEHQTRGASIARCFGIHGLTALRKLGLHKVTVRERAWLFLRSLAGSVALLVNWRFWIALAASKRISEQYERE